jgi:hypothetical protein
VKVRWVTAVALLVAAPVRAQFDPAFNHLFCYNMHEVPGQVFTPVSVTVETQLGVEPNVSVMRPAILCAPADKTGGGVDPLPPTAVPHFTCYRPKRDASRGVTVQVTDQFGTGTYTITSDVSSAPRTVKELGSPSGAFLP